MKNLMTILMLSLGGYAFSQAATGEITGKLMTSTGEETVPFASIIVYSPDSSIAASTTSGDDGRFRIAGLVPGSYDLAISDIGNGKFSISFVQVKPDEINTLGPINFPEDGISVIGPIVVPHTKKLIDPNQTSLTTIEAKDFKHNPNIQQPLKMLAGMSSEIKLTPDGKDAYVRGSRPGSVVYFVDGVKTDGMGTIPGGAIGRMQVYTGGVPAKYGDTVGGVISMDTKSYFDLYRAAEARELRAGN